MFSYTRRHRTQPQRFALTLSVLTSLLTSLLLPSIAHAAPGFGTLSVTPDSGVIAMNAPTDLTFKINAEDVALFSVNFDATLTNATLDSYDCSTSSFTSLATVVSGGTKGSTAFTVVASLQGDGKAETNTDLTICNVSIVPVGEGAVGVTLSNTQAYEVGDETPTLVPTQATTASFTTSATAPGTTTDSQLTLPTIAERTNKSVIPSTNKTPRIVSDTELVAVRTAPVEKGSVVSTWSLIVGGATVLILGALIGATIHRLNIHKKFIRRHGLDKYTRFMR